MKKLSRACTIGVSIVIATTVLSGCAGRTTKFAKEPYVATSGQPTAKLTNSLSPLLEDSDLATVLIPLDDCKAIKANADLKESVSRQGVVFDMTAKSTMAGKAVDIVAGRPIRLHYLFSDGLKRSRVCSVGVVVTLEPNKEYSLVGGYTTVKKDFPSFDKPGCALGVLDMQTKRLVPNTGNLCPNN